MMVREFHFGNGLLQIQYVPEEDTWLLVLDAHVEFRCEVHRSHVEHVVQSVPITTHASPEGLNDVEAAIRGSHESAARICSSLVDRAVRLRVNNLCEGAA